MDEMEEAQRKVRMRLDAARELAEEAFNAPGEETVMQLFARICVEIDLYVPPEDDDMPAFRVH